MQISGRQARHKGGAGLRRDGTEPGPGTGSVPGAVQSRDSLGSALARAAAKSGPCASVYFRKATAQLLDSLNIALPKWKNSLDSFKHNQQRSSHLGRRAVLYNARNSALGGAAKERGREGGQTPGTTRVSTGNSSRYMQESAKQAGF